VVGGKRGYLPAERILRITQAELQDGKGASQEGTPLSFFMLVVEEEKIRWGGFEPGKKACERDIIIHQGLIKN